MTLLSPNHNYAADECIAQIPQHHIPTAEEKVRASERFDKAVLVAAHMAALHDAYIMEMATHPVSEVVIKPSSPTSSIGGLKPSTLKQLKVGKVHRRRVLSGTLCAKTLCTKSHNGHMVVNVLEDEEGNATPIYLSNAMEGNGGSAQAQQLYPQDSKVAVKEPYLTRLPDGEIVLLVEKTTDLVFLWVPEIVKENGAANGGSSDSGLCEKGKDAFAVEKTEDASVKGVDFVKDEETDGGVEVVDNEKRIEEVCEDDGVEEAVKSSKASRELKFEDTMNAKEEKDNVKISEDAKLHGDADAEEDSSGACVIVGDNIEENSVSAKEEETEEREVEGEEAAKGDVSRELNIEDVIAMPEGEQDDSGDHIGKNSMDFKEEEANKGEVEATEAAKGDVSRELSSDDLLGMRKGEQDGGVVEKEQGGEEKATEAAKGDVSRESSLDDMLAMRKGEQDGGVVEKEQGGEEKLNAAEVCDLKTSEISVGGVEEEAMKEDLSQAKLSVSPRDVDVGETAASLRVKGNAIFARGDCNKAAAVYARAAEKARSDGLKMEEVLCLSNRAEVWLRLCRNQAAFDDAEAALKLLRECDGINDGDLALAKALFRKGRALMGLHKYEDAMRVLQEVVAKAPADRQLREAAMRCRNRLQQVLKPGKRQRAAINRRKSASFAKQ